MAVCAVCGEPNREGARFCNACGAPLQVEGPALAEERKTVSVVFVDLVGFTARAERLDPEDVRALLTPYHAHVRSELERHGGTVEKFIGDAVMAVFGAPVAREDDPERAVRAALAICGWSADQDDLQVRAAVNTGPALVKITARASEGEAMVAGDVVNTAARMQAAAPVNGVLVGATTYRATRDTIRYRDAEPLDAKGKAEPVAVWEAVEPVARQGVDLGGPPRAALVGRDREVELLRSIVDRVRGERAPQLVTIVGVPGIGKSRLVRELFELVDAQPELIAWRQGRCLAYGEKVTFWALGEIAKAEAGILESDSNVQAEEKLRDVVATLTSDGSERRWLETELRALVGVGRDGSNGGGTTTAAWRRFLEAVAERGPAVVVFEDLHWADDGLLDFLDDLVDWLRDVPLLLVATARPELLERRPAWGGGKANATTISLQPLNDADAARLVADLMQQPLQLADEQRKLLDRAGGNPLFAEQYVRMLAERGTTGELPESVQGVIAARLDAVSAQEKALLQEAAVHGKVFSIGALAAAIGVQAEDAEKLLRALERKDFVRRERRSALAGDPQYAFHHVLVRDVAYGQIPRRARAQKHAQAAAWIEGLGRREDQAELLAYHYQQALELGRAAGDDDPALVRKARGALQAAGERALALSALASAAEFFAAALDLSSASDAERPRLLLGRARALAPTGAATLELLQEALAGFDAVGDVEGMAEAAVVAARVSWFSGDRAATDRLLSRALEAVGERGESRARAEALANQCGFLMLEGRYEESIRVGTAALPLIESLGMEDQRARIAVVVGSARYGLGDAGGFDQIRRGMEIAEAAANFELVVIGCDNLASGLMSYGRLDEARAALRRQLDLSSRYGLGRALRFGRQAAACWDYLDGRWDEALAGVDELLALAEAGDRHYCDPASLALRAWIQLARGDDAAADADSRRAVELARDSDQQAKGAAFCARAAVALELGDRVEALELADELEQLGPQLLTALNSPYPTPVDAAFLFRDLDRGTGFRDAVLQRDPVRSRWNDAASAVCDNRLVEAAEIADEIGHHAVAAYARLRAAGAFVADGRPLDAAAQRALSDAFYVACGATRFATARDSPAAPPVDRAAS